MSRNSPSTSRRRLVQAALASSVAPWIGTGHAQTKIVCRVAHSEAIGSPLSDALQRWVDVLNAKSGGRIDAQHFPASQLGSYTQLIEQSRLGTIQATVGGPDTEESVAPEIAATGGAPGFIYKDEVHVDKVLQGPIGAEVSAIARRKTGVEFVAYGEVGFRHLLCKRPVATLDQLKGVKIRVPEIKIWVDFGAALAPTPRRCLTRSSTARCRRVSSMRWRRISFPSADSSGTSRQSSSRCPITGSCPRPCASMHAGWTASRPTCRRWSASPRARCSPSSARPIARRRTRRRATWRRPA